MDAEDLPIWRAAGLSINEAGFLQQTSAVREDIVSNGMIWLLSRIVNYLAISNEVLSNQRQDGECEPGQKILLENWQRLEKELEVWFSSLPSSFKVGAVVNSPYGTRKGNMENGAQIPTIWYSMSMCGKVLFRVTLTNTADYSNSLHNAVLSYG